MPLCEAIGGLIGLSDLLDAQLRVRLQAYREGCQAAEQAHADDYSRGYIDGVLARKHAEHDAVEAVRLHLARWELRGEARTRAMFGQPHPGDFTGREVAA